MDKKMIKPKKDVDRNGKKGKKDYLIGYKNNKKAHVVLYCFDLYYQCNILSF